MASITAIEADWRKQNFTTMGVGHYYDLKRHCFRCRQPFIFFAEEQKFWYEDLHLRLEVRANYCWSCRKQNRGVAAARQRYEELFHIAVLSESEAVEMAEHCLLLMEEKQFSPRKAEHVRALLKRVPEKTARRLGRRLETFEARH